MKMKIRGGKFIRHPIQLVKSYRRSQLVFTLGVGCVGERRLVGDILTTADQIVLNDRSLVLELPPEATMVVLRT